MNVNVKLLNAWVVGLMIIKSGQTCDLHLSCVLAYDFKPSASVFYIGSSCGIHCEPTSSPPPGGIWLLETPEFLQFPEGELVSALGFTVNSGEPKFPWWLSSEPPAH
jgi:hypothetical protein